MCELRRNVPNQLCWAKRCPVNIHLDENLPIGKEFDISLMETELQRLNELYYTPSSKISRWEKSRRQCTIKEQKRMSLLLICASEICTTATWNIFEFAPCWVNCLLECNTYKKLFQNQEAQHLRYLYKFRMTLLAENLGDQAPGYST